MTNLPSFFSLLFTLFLLPTFAWSQPATDEQFDDELSLTSEEEIISDVPIEAIQRFVQLYSLIKQHYIHEISDEQLFQNAMIGVAQVDKYSRYLPADKYQELLQYTEADLATVGFNLQHQALTNEWQISQLKDHSDAHKLGLKNGMSIYKIDQQILSGLNSEQVNDLLVGQMGSSIQIQLGAKTQPITLIRNKKTNVDIEYQTLVEEQILWIKIPIFQQTTVTEVKRIIEDQLEVDSIKRIVIDLRNNPGGLLSAAVELVDLFLSQGVIVTTKSRSEGTQSFRAVGSSVFPQDVAIIINGRSASAAEVFTAALKQNYRAIVVGEKSYGKGVVQKVLPLGNQDAVSLTVANYYTPDGEQLEGKGVEPNLVYPIQNRTEDDYIHKIASLLADYDEQISSSR